MCKQSNLKTCEQMAAAVLSLDLDPIKFKLMDRKEGHGWTREKADRIEQEYRRFLVLSVRYPEAPVVPSTDVDKFWHAHILDTMKYAADCQQAFGYFLHHFPYFGMRGDEDAAALAQAADTTKRLYQQEFGEAPAKDAAKEDTAYCARAAASDAAYCARAAGPAADAAYCARVTAPADDTAYCARAAAPEPAYCARAAAGESADLPAYCARAGAGYLDALLEKGRPSLEPAA